MKPSVTQVTIITAPLQPGMILTLPDELGPDEGWIVVSTSLTMAQSSPVDPRPSPVLLITLAREVDKALDADAVKSPGPKLVV